MDPNNPDPVEPRDNWVEFLVVLSRALGHIDETEAREAMRLYCIPVDFRPDEEFAWSPVPGFTFGRAPG